MVIKTHLHLPWSYEKWLKTNFFQKIHTFEVLNNLAAHLLILEIFSYYVTLVFGPTWLLKFRCAFLHAYGAPYFYFYFQILLQGLPSGFDLMYLALTDRIMQVRFGLKVVGES